MRYNLGYMDKYPIEAAGSSIENNPMLRVFFKRPIDPIRLEEAIYKALDAYPLFKTKVKFDHEYYLITNERPLVILNVKEEERPLDFGATTNHYPFRVTYFENKMCFEWLHGITDGAGAKIFLKDILLAYFNYDPVEKSKSFLVAPGLEPFYDKKEKGDNFVIEPQGYSIKDFPREKHSFAVECHSLRCKTEDLVNFSRTCKSSVAPVLTVLYSKAIRNHIPKDVKNKNVSCNIAMDVRKNLNYETMHNCVDLKRFTYTDEYETMNFKTVAEIYKAKLDNARKTPNVIKSVTDRVKVFKLYHYLRFKCLLKATVKLYGLMTRDTDCNFVLTYIGKMDLPEEVIEKIENIDLKLIPDYGQCVLGAVDFNGNFNLNIHSNLKDKTVNDEFIKISKELGLYWEDKGKSQFIQSHFIEKKRFSLWKK